MDEWMAERGRTVAWCGFFGGGVKRAWCVCRISSARLVWCVVLCCVVFCCVASFFCADVVELGPLDGIMPIAVCSNL